MGVQSERVFSLVWLGEKFEIIQGGVFSLFTLSLLFSDFSEPVLDPKKISLNQANFQRYTLPDCNKDSEKNGEGVFLRQQRLQKNYTKNKTFFQVKKLLQILIDLFRVVRMQFCIYFSCF